MSAERIKIEIRHLRRFMSAIQKTIAKKTKKCIVSLRSPTKLKETSQVLSIERQDNIKKAKIGHFKIRPGPRLNAKAVLIR